MLKTLKDDLKSQQQETTKLTSLVGELPSQMAALRTEMSEMQNGVTAGDDFILERLDTVAQLAKIERNTPPTESLCGKGQGKCGSAPQIGAAGANMIIEAPFGSVGVVAKGCEQGVDICELATLAAQLKAALVKFEMDDA
jgi:hypothetical protein